MTLAEGKEVLYGYAIAINALLTEHDESNGAVVQLEAMCTKVAAQLAIDYDSTVDALIAEADDRAYMYLNNIDIIGE
jgi:hypothetical protein